MKVTGPSFCRYRFMPSTKGNQSACAPMEKVISKTGFREKLLACRGVVRGRWENMGKTMKHWNERVDELRSKSSYVVLHGGKSKVDMERVAKCMRHIYGEERWPPTSIGEIGTGAATMLNLLCEETISLRHNRSLCHGVDPSTSAIEIAKGQFPHIVTDVSSLFATSSVPQIRNGRFDLVVSYGVAIYLTEQQFCTHIADALLHLRPGGRFQMWQLSSSYRGGVWRHSMGRTHVHPSVFNSSRGVLWPCRNLSNFVHSIRLVSGWALPNEIQKQIRKPQRQITIGRVLKQYLFPPTEEQSWFQNPSKAERNKYCKDVNYLSSDDYVVQIERNGVSMKEEFHQCTKKYT
eukprot:PhF_6_TR30435/c1_g1_i3/m.44678